MSLLKELLDKKIIAIFETGLSDDRIFLLKLDTGERFTLEIKAHIVYEDPYLEIEFRPFTSDDIAIYDLQDTEIVDSGFMTQSEADGLEKEQEEKSKQRELDRLKCILEQEKAEYLKLKAKFEGK